ncbi:MAG: hypothetical protein ABSD74_15655 [Rhizomicrobium sp.]|jgi:nucleoside 2-deoxyribosyltransferase
MDKIVAFFSKARYPAVFLVIGAFLLLAACARTIKIFELDVTLYGPAAQIPLGIVALAMLGLGAFLALKDRGMVKVAPEYDVFLAAPMAGIDTEEEYQAIRSLCLEVMALMRTYAGVKDIYFVGEKLQTQKDFESYDVAAEKDFDAIAASRNFVLIYPRKVLSSVIAETGFALARGIPVTLFTASAADLPYLLKQAGSLPHDRYPPVHIREYGTPEKLKKLIMNDGAAAFEHKAAAKKAKDDADDGADG